MSQLVNSQSGYAANAFRQDMFRAGHAHAGVLLLLSLVVLRYVDDVDVSSGLRHLIRNAAPFAAILMPAGFFLSVVSPQASEPNGFVYLIPAGAVVLATGLILLGFGLLKPVGREEP